MWTKSVSISRNKFGRATDSFDVFLCKKHLKITFSSPDTLCLIFLEIKQMCPLGFGGYGSFNGQRRTKQISDISDQVDYYSFEMGFTICANKT